MSLFSKIGLGIYYRIRRMKKALKNWRKFGVIIFGSILVATGTGFAPANLVSGADADPKLTYLYTDPTTLSVKQGGSFTFSYKAYDQNWKAMTITPAWSMNKAAAGSITSAGVFTASTTIGTYTNAIKLTSGALTTYAKVVVYEDPDPITPPPAENKLTYLYTDPTTISVKEGGSFTVGYKAYDQDYQPMTITPNWAMNKSVAGSITSAGVFTASHTIGTYSNAIKLTSGALTAYAKVIVVKDTITPPPVTSKLTYLYTDPTTLSVKQGGSFTFSYKAYDQNWKAMTITPAWSMNKAAAGSITSAGVFTASTTIGTYTNAIKLTSGALTTYAKVIVYTDEQPVNQPPVARITVSPTSGTTSLVVALNASASTDSDGTIVKYEWDYDNNGTYDFNSGNDATVSHTYAIGTWTPKVRVTDNDGATGVATSATSIVVDPATINLPPNAVIAVSPLSGVTSLLVNLNAAASTDSDGTIVKYEWDYDNNGTYDFNSGNDATVSHTYAIGTWTPKVRVTDNDGATDTATAATPITVTEADQQQLNYVVIDPPLKYLDFYENHQFTATAYDQDEHPIPSNQVSFYWDVVNGGGMINSNNGTFTAGNLADTFDHTVRVRATMFGNNRYARATVVVNPITTQAVLERVEILPPSVTIDRYEDYDFAAYAYDTNGAQMYSDVVYTWEVISGPGSVNQNGIYTATGSTNSATVRVEARQGNIRVYDEADVYISGNDDCSGILDRVVITPQTGYVQTGNSIDFDAIAYDTTGCVVSTDLYFSLDGNVPGTINQNGYFTAQYTTGTYNDDVRVRAYKDGREVYDYADVVINNNNQNYYIDANLHAYDETISSDYRANEGDTILYTLRLTNNRSNTLTSTKVTMEVPDYTTFISVSASSGIPSISNRTAIWELGTLYAGETKTMWLRVRVKEGVPSNTTIRGKAFVQAYEMTNGFWVYSNDLPVNGTGTGPLEPLTPTGAMEWILAAITALLATIFTRQLIKTRQLLAQR